MRQQASQCRSSFLRFRMALFPGHVAPRREHEAAAAAAGISPGIVGGALTPRHTWGEEQSLRPTKRLGASGMRLISLPLSSGKAWYLWAFPVLQVLTAFAS